jgi:hypothetical protein
VLPAPLRHSVTVSRANAARDTVFAGELVLVLLWKPWCGVGEATRPSTTSCLCPSRVPCSIRGLGWSLSLGVDEHARGAV